MKTLFTFLLLNFLLFGFAQIVNIPDPNFKAALLAHDPVIDTNSDGEIQVSEAEALAFYLNVNDKGISDMTGLEAFVNITSLGCNSNNLTSIDLTSLVHLQSFGAWGNQLESLDVSQNPVLEVISISDSNLTELDVTANPLLRELQIGYNEISELDLSQNPDLAFITPIANPLVVLDFSQNPNLQFASISSCYELRMINFQNGNNEILDFYMYDNPNLECVQIDPEFIGNIPEEWDYDGDFEFSENCVLGLEESDLSQIKIFPNPVRNQFNISHTERIQLVEIYSLSGQLVQQIKEQSITIVQVNQLPKGTYIVRAQTQTGKVFTEKIIIK